MQTQNQPPEIYQNIVLNGECLNSHYKTGLATLLGNAPLLAISQRTGTKLSSRDADFLLTSIEAACITLGDTLSAMSFALSDKQAPASEYITPHLLTDFAALVGELMPLLQTLSGDIRLSEKTNP